MISQIPTEDIEKNNLSQENVNTQQGGNQGQQNIIQYKYEPIGGSNNSTIYEMFQVDPTQYPQKKQPTGQVMKTVQHTCSKPSSKSQLFIHRKECQDMANEYQIMSQLDHPGILRVNQLFNQEKNQCAMIMPKADCDLFQYIKNQQSQINLSVIRKIYKQAADALKYMHTEKNLTHNDLKLANYFLFMKQGEMKLADFGFAKFQQEDNCPEEQFQRWQNRAPYTMSPEMIQKVSNQNKEDYVSEYKSDVFSFGITLFQTVFKKCPFSSQIAKENDQLFQNFYNKQYQKFWQDAQVTQTLSYYKNEQNSKLSLLLDLITKCLYVDPQERISMTQVTEHPWFGQ